MNTHCIPRPLINLLLQAALADKELKPVIKEKQQYNSASNSLEGQHPLEGDKMKQRRKRDEKAAQPWQGIKTMTSAEQPVEEIKKSIRANEASDSEWRSARFSLKDAWECLILRRLPST